MKYQGGRSRAQRTRCASFRQNWLLSRWALCPPEGKRESTTQFRSLLNSRESEIGSEMAPRWPFHTLSSADQRRKAAGSKARLGRSPDFHSSGVTQIDSKRE